MGLAQVGALQHNTRFKRPYVEEINARTPYLPALHSQKKEDQYRDKMYGLEKQGLALEQDALKEAKKRNKTARNIGYANIGLGAGLGILNNYDTIKDGVSSLFPSLDSAPDVIGGVTEFSPGQDFGGITETISPGVSSSIDWVSDQFASPILKTLGEGWDAVSGIYDSLVNPIVDIDWDWDFADSIGM